jgi:hypothetical protein
MVPSTNRRTVELVSLLLLACSAGAQGQSAQDQSSVSYDFTRRAHNVPEALNEAEVAFQAVLRDTLKAHRMSEAQLTRWPDYRIEIRVACATVACPPDEEVAISVAMVREYRVADKLADYLFGRGGRQQPSDSQLVALAWSTPTLGDRLWFTWTGIARRSEVREAAGFLARDLRRNMRPYVSTDPELNSQAEALLRKWPSP